MLINEVFKSVQGEGTYAGVPMVFVRLQGCNLFPKGCSYCDTKYGQDTAEGKEIDIEELLKAVHDSKLDHVCITGGEPLYQEKELEELIKNLDCFTEIETNGTLPPPSWHDLVNSWVVDIKCPSSKIDKFEEGWLDTLTFRDQIKLVVKNTEDLQFAEKWIKKLRTKKWPKGSPTILLSPVILFEGKNRVWDITVWNYCVENNIRFSYQIHKVLFGNKKGV